MNHFSIPRHWTPQQALACLDILEQLHSAIWETYQDPLVEIIATQMAVPEPPDDEPCADLDDDIPW